ncbi:MAG: DUF4397 domain-containing protein [Thermomicrobiales bacterium]
MVRSRQMLLRLIGIGALLGLLAASLGLTSAQTEEAAGLRIVHAGIDTPPVNVTVNGESVAENLFWLEATEYMDVPAGDHEISIFDPDTSTEQALSTATVTLETGNNYSAVISGELPTPSIVLIVDGNDGDIDAGMGGIRLFNSVPDNGEIDLVGNTEARLIEGVAPMTVSDYVMAEAGSYELDFYESGTDNRIFIEQGLTVEEGVYQTVYLSGFADPGNFSAEILVDELRESGDGEPTATEAEPTATGEAATTETATGTAEASPTEAPPTETPAPTATPEPTATATPAPSLPSTGAGGTATSDGGTNLLLFSTLAVLCLAASGGLFYWTRRFN